jgi:YbbR domain-containing protein
MSWLKSRDLFEKAVNNWPAKVLSVFLAIVLFVFHRMSALEERFFSVPLIIETNGDLTPSSSYPRMIRVTLRGDANSIYPIVEEDIVPYLDMTKYTEAGSFRAPVEVRKQGTAMGVDPLEIGVDPLEITLELDHKVSKYVPLTPIYQGYVESGYELVSYSLDPAQAAIEGPQKLMAGITELNTEYVELSGRNADFSTSVRILNRDPLIIIRGSGTTEFRGFIRAAIIIRNIDQIPIEISGLDEELSAEAEIREGAIRLEGSQNELENYVPQGTIMRLDCSGITQEGSRLIPVTVTVPPQFTVSRIEPAEVMVVISRKNTEES